jgi:hypothetical protein
VYNRQVLVGWLTFSLEGFWTLWDNIYDVCVCCYNRCHCNAVKGFWALIFVTMWSFIHGILCTCIQRITDIIISRQDHIWDCTTLYHITPHSKIQPLASSSQRGVTSLDSEQGSGPPKPRCEVSCRGLHGTKLVIVVLLTIPLGHRAAPCCINVFHPYGALWVVTFVPWFSWNENGTRK